MLGRADPPPSPPAIFQSFKKLPDKTNKYNCLLLGNAACSKSIFIKLGRREGKKRHLRKGCVKARGGGRRKAGLCGAPAPAGSSGDAPAPPALAPLPRQRFSNRTFLSEAAVPHHANAVTKRRRYYGKDFSASYSRVRDSAAGRSRLLAGELAGNQPLPQHPTWPQPGLRQSGAVRCRGHHGSLSRQTTLLVFREDDVKSRQQILATSRDTFRPPPHLL